MTPEQKAAVKETVELLNNMVTSGESHTTESETKVSEALAILSEEAEG